MRKVWVAVVALLLAWTGWSQYGAATEQVPEHDGEHHGASATSASPCRVAIEISQEAELRLGGALYAGPEVAQHSEHAQSMPEMEGAHMSHQPRYEGALFMAPNKMHHLEGVYSEDCGFQLFLYNAFSEHIHVDRFQAFVHVLPSREDELDIFRFLSPANRGTVLATTFGDAISRPFEIELYVKFPDSDEPQLFNIFVR